jgi:hypothetical protein
MIWLTNCHAGLLGDQRQRGPFLRTYVEESIVFTKVTTKQTLQRNALVFAQHALKHHQQYNSKTKCNQLQTKYAGFQSESKSTRRK